MSEKRLFVKGAYLYSTPNELSEKEFIRKAGGIKKLLALKGYPFVSLILDNPKAPILSGHRDGRTINMAISGRGHKLYQTMEWR
jgi:hypothetical protein